LRHSPDGVILCAGESYAMMIDFKLPVAFAARPDDRKAVTTVVGTVVVDVDLRECEPGELADVAELAFDIAKGKRWTKFVHRHDVLYSPLATVESLPRTFAPCGPKPGFPFDRVEPRLRRTIDDRVYQARRRGSLYPPASARSRRFYEPLILRPVEQMNLNEVDEQTLARQIADFRHRCSRLLVSGGMVYLSVSEPVLGVDLVEKDGQAKAYVRPVWRKTRGLGTAKNGAIPPHAVFRLDDLEGIRRFCDLAGVPFRPPKGVRVWDPARLSIDSEQLTVFSAAARIVRKAQDWIGKHQVIDEIFDIVERSEDDTDYPPHLGDLLVDALEVHRSGTRVFSNEMDVVATQGVTELWDARSISVGISETLTTNR